MKLANFLNLINLVRKNLKIIHSDNGTNKTTN